MWTALDHFQFDRTSSVLQGAGRYYYWRLRVGLYPLDSELNIIDFEFLSGFFFAVENALIDSFREAL